jgi:Holliday junction resolvase RusA-like endonuclease
MTTINIPPLSVNACWQGKRFKTPAYKAYEKQVLLTLRPMKLPPAPFSLRFEFGFSSPLSDIDNGIKPLTDILQRKYGFNDREIFELHVVKELVKKGQEYSRFEFSTYPLPLNTDNPTLQTNQSNQT